MDKVKNVKQLIELLVIDYINIIFSIIHHQCCCLLIADKMIVGIRTQSFFLVDRRAINCIGIERATQNCSYMPLPRPHALLTLMDPLALVDCKG